MSNQGACLVGVPGSGAQFMREFDSLPYAARARLSQSHFNLCAACVHSGGSMLEGSRSPGAESYIRVIELMERSLRSGHPRDVRDLIRDELILREYERRDRARYREDDYRRMSDVQDVLEYTRMRFADSYTLPRMVRVPVLKAASMPMYDPEEADRPVETEATWKYEYRWEPPKWKPLKGSDFT